MNEFMKHNYEHLLKSAKNICSKNGANDDPYEVLNYAVLQLLESNKKNEIIDSGFGVFWLIRVMTNSVFSSSSDYRRNIRSITNDEIDIHVVENIKGLSALLNDSNKVYNETYNYDIDNAAEVIKDILNDIEKQDIAGWYMVNLFRIYVEKKNISNISKETNIPRKSITNAIKRCREIVIKELKNRNIQYEF